MNSLSRDRWVALWKAADASGDPHTCFDNLATAYAEPHRYYHNQQHIAECLAQFDAARHLAGQPAAVEFALWFHDVVYDPKAGDNEEKSAAMAKRCLEEAGSPAMFPDAVSRFVMATKNHEVGTNKDAALMVDVDLSILGQSKERFMQYETQIREEYAWVPESIFSQKRAEILGRFLGCKQIFATEWFHQKFETQARDNLKASISRLLAR